MPRVASAKTLKNKATVLHSRIVRSRGACEHCGESRPEKLQCAHIVSRKYAATRVDPENAFCLCAGCHWDFTLWPLEFAEFTIGKIGQERYDELRRKANQGVKTNAAYWREQLDYLESLLSEAT